jgi:NitT/TauT family transport system substrate-binding protein
MKMGKPALALSFASLAALIAIRSHAAPAERPQKVVVAYSSISGNTAPLWVTHERGLFRKHGLETQLVFIEGGSRTVQTLVAGDVAFAHMAGAAVVQSNLRGADAIMIAGVVNTLTFQFIVDKSITQPDHLKGKTVAVTRFGSSTDFAMRYALEKYGLQPDREVAILQLGSMPALFAALEGGKIQGAMLSSPFTLKAKKAGFPVLADLQMLGLEYQHTGIATTRALIKSQPDLVRRFMKAYVEGIHYYKTHPKESMAIIAKYLKTDDADALKEIYEDIGLALVPQKPYPTLRGIQTILRELAGREPKAESAKPEQFVDLTFIKELDASGYIDALYKPALAAKREEPRAATAASEKAAEGKIKVAAKAPTPEKAKGEAPAQARSNTAVARAEPAALPGPGVAPDRREYVVQKGDTLSRLAERFYGSILKWEKIYAANRESVKNPHFIYIGQKLIIPADDSSGG